MNSLASARTLEELKSHYRRLAARHHPDKGGNGILMQTINVQYQHLQMRLKKAANDQAEQSAESPDAFSENDENTFTEEAASQDTFVEDFSTLSSGDIVYVNGTRCEVIEVSKYYFRILACGRCRQAQICKTTGRGRFNPRLRASYSMNNREYYQNKSDQYSGQTHSTYKH